MYKVGEWVYDLIRNEKVQIIEKNEIWGFVSYKVFDPGSNNIYKLSEEQIGQNITNLKYDENYVRYVNLLSKIKNETSGGLLANLSSGIIPLPHQLHVLNRAVSSNNMRYILADEVGLGKTIEAGLIIKELKARGLIKRILVVCPTGLVTQWSLEMSEKFGEKFHVILPSEITTIRKITDNDDIYGQFDQVISPMDSIKPLEKRAGWTEEKIKEYNEERIYSIINSGWDLIIIDEAHRVAGSSSEVARHKLGSLLSKSSPYLLLLTATPHSGKTEPFLRLVRLIDEKAFPNYKAIVKEQVAPYLIRTEKREAIDNEGNKLFKNRVTKVVDINWNDRHSMQKKLYELVTKYVEEGYNRAVKEKKYYIGFLMVLMQRLVTSSTAAIKDSIEKRIEILENSQDKLRNLSILDLIESDLEQNLDEALETISLNINQELTELKEILEVAKQAEFQYIDAKIEKLIDILDTLHSKDKECKVILFTEFVSTQDYLNEFLKSRGYTISLLNGSMSIDERNMVLKDFKTKSNILISTDAGGEGLNLQFANVVINYDLPWNPMKIEQRIGRVDRIGQKQDVSIFNFIISDTVENRVKTVLEDKLSVILSETGIDKMSDVLDNEIAEIDFTNVYIDSIRNLKNIEYNVSKIEDDLKKQLKSVSEFKEIIREEKDLTKSCIDAYGFDIDIALREMLDYYCCWNNENPLPTSNLSINDEEIVKHLKKEFIWNSEELVPCIEIKDFPNEKGYFMLWELSINDDKHCKKVIPVFINDDFVVRPLSGKKIWDVFLKKDKKISVNDHVSIDKEIFEKLYKNSQSIAFDVFTDIKNDYEKSNEEKFKKYSYAISLRIEAALKIGIENIKKHRLKALETEKEEIFSEYKRNKKICPVFKPVFIACLER